MTWENSHKTLKEQEEIACKIERIRVRKKNNLPNNSINNPCLTFNLNRKTTPDQRKLL